MKLSRAFLLLAAMGIGYGQESRGTILGRVTDSSDAVMVGVRVHAVSLATNTGGSAITNHDGNYEIPLLQPGTYRVTAELAGFKKSVREPVEVNVDDKLVLDFAMQLGEISSSVTVSAGEELTLEAATPSIGMLIDSRQLTELPVAGGSPFYLAKLTAGVSSSQGHMPGNPFDLGSGSGALVVNGTRSGNSDISIDGASNMSGTNGVFSPMQDLVQEFKIQTLAFDASVGHGTGAVVNVSIKSGANLFHGSTYYFDSRLRSTPWFVNNWLYDPATGPLTAEKRQFAGNAGWLHQRWGDTISGPVAIPRLYNGRNRTFFVFGYEGMYVRRTPTFRGTVPTAAERNGDFSALLALGSRYQIYDPFTVQDMGGGTFSRQPLPGNIVPARLISPIARKIAGYWPLPNSPGTSDGLNNFFRVSDENKDYRSFLTRVDHSFSENHRAYLRVNQSFYKDNIQTMPTLALGDIDPRGAWGAVLDDVYVLSPRSLVDVRYGFTYMNPVTMRYSQGFDLTTLGFSRRLVDQIAANVSPAGFSFPQVKADSFTQIGAGGGSFTATNYHTLSATFTILAGNHSLRTGGEFRLMRENGYSYGNVAPNLTFGTTWTKGPNQNSGAAPMGQGLASMLYGIASGGGTDVNASRAEQSTFTAGYVQDDWKLARRLTLNLGLRYEWESPTTDRYNRSVRGFDFAAMSPIAAQAVAAYAAAPIPQIPVESFRVLGGLTFPGANGLPRALWNSDKNNFAPRVGLAWRLGNRTVVRTGYGIFFGLMGIDRQDVNQGGFNQTTPIVASQDNGLTYRATLANLFPDGIQTQTGARLGLRTMLGKAPSFFNTGPLNPYMQRWTFSIQRQLPGRTVLEVAYVGNRGNKLNANRQFDPIPRQYLSTAPVRDQPAIDLLGAQVTNPFAAIADFIGTNLAATKVARSQLLRPYPEFTGITANLPLGYSWYHSLQVQAQKRFAHGMSFQLGYTWSKFMEATAFRSATDAQPEKVISDQDRPHRIIFGMIYELPVGRGKRLLGGARGVLNGIAGGWQVQGWYEGQTGQPLGFGNAIFLGNLQDIPLPVAQRSVTQWFNVNAGFERNSARQLANNIQGLSTRFNNVRGDGINNLDMSLFKTFRVTEKIKAQVRAEAYNALNHAQFANPNMTPDNTAFGTVTAENGHGQRQVTFGVKLMF